MAQTQNLNQILALEPIQWLVDSLLPKKGILVLGGPPKRGKSRLLLSEMLAAVQMQPFLGQFEQTIFKPLIFNAEGGFQGIRMRSGMYQNVDTGRLARIDISELAKPLVNGHGITDMAVYANMLAQIQGHDVFVLDPLVCFHACDENDNQQMTAVMNAIRGLCNDSGAAAIIVHHTAKLSEDTSTYAAKNQGGMKLRGASAIFAAADNVAMAWPAGKNALSLVFDLRYAANPGEIIMTTCNCREPDGCGRFYRQTEGPHKSKFGDPAAWKVDHPKGDAMMFAKAWGITGQVAGEVMR